MANCDFIARIAGKKEDVDKVVAFIMVGHRYGYSVFPTEEESDYEKDLTVYGDVHVSIASAWNMDKYKPTEETPKPEPEPESVPSDADDDAAMLNFCRQLFDLPKKLSEGIVDYDKIHNDFESCVDSKGNILFENFVTKYDEKKRSEGPSLLDIKGDYTLEVFSSKNPEPFSSEKRFQEHYIIKHGEVILRDRRFYSEKWELGHATGRLYGGYRECDLDFDENKIIPEWGGATVHMDDAGHYSLDKII